MPYEFYRRSVELVAVRRSKIVTVRFFIPPAVVDSKGFPAKPIAWMLDWEVEGVRMPVEPKRFPHNFSKKLQDPATLKTFQNLSAEGALKNDGVMLAQYHGPANLQPKSNGKDFAFARKDE